MSIPFTQYLMPYGLKRAIMIDRSPEIESLAKKIIEAGYRFEIEMLQTGEVSMEIVKDIPDPEPDDCLGGIVCVNGPSANGILGVPESVDKLIQGCTTLLNESKTNQQKETT